MSQPPLNPRDVLGLESNQLPRHIAIIMDGNGRWAGQRGMPRVQGHEQGAHNVREIVTECARLGIGCLTLYSFSLENWKRPIEEVAYLMDLYYRYLIAERQTILENNIRFVQIGRREGLPDRVLAELDETARLSRDHRGMVLCLALNYGSRAEIVDAVRRIAGQAARGELKPEQIDEALFSRTLYTADLPDPDLLIRTSGELRISNFLLWQISYAELYVTDTHWPDFHPEQLHAAIRAFAERKRRYGGIESA